MRPAGCCRRLRATQPGTGCSRHPTWTRCASSAGPARWGWAWTRRRTSWPPTAAVKRRADGPGDSLEQRIAEIDHTLRELRELRASLVAARRTDHTGADRSDDPKSTAGGVCPMIEDATTAAGRS